MEVNHKKNCHCVKEEVWIVPKKELKSSWDCDYVTKDMFMEALGLQLIVHEDNENGVEAEEVEKFHPEQEQEPDKNGDDEPIQNQNQEEQHQTFPCPKCPKQLKDRRSLKSHIYDAHSGTRFCSLCPKTFKRYCHLRRHIMEVHRKHKDVMFMCPNCGKLFSRKEFLTKHNVNCHENHVNDLKFNCRYCEKQFKSKSAKKFHERRNTKLRWMVVTC